MMMEFMVSVDVRWEDREGRYVARSEEYPELMGLGLTPAAAANEFRCLLQDWLKLLAKQSTGKTP